MAIQNDIEAVFCTEPQRQCSECFSPTEALEFWIWDPEENPSKPYLPQEQPANNGANMLLEPTYRQRAESLNVICNCLQERVFVAIDKCLITTGGLRCEGLILYKKNGKLVFHWIELKMFMKIRNPNPKTLEDRCIGDCSATNSKNAVLQIQTTIDHFREKGIGTTNCLNFGHIGIPKQLESLAKKSDTIKNKFRKTQKEHNLTLKIGASLSLG